MSAQDKYSLQERGRFKAWWDAARPLEGSAFPYEIAWATWQAALTAQPSPTIAEPIGVQCCGNGSVHGCCGEPVPVFDDEQSDRQQFSDWWAAQRTDIGLLSPYEIARLGWNGALSAKPSPVGQDARSLLADEYDAAGSDKRATLIREGRDHAPSTSYALRAIEAALAARQPVGEPDAWQCIQKNGLSVGGIYRSKEEARLCGLFDEEIDTLRPLYASPVQAVDLGQFRRAVRWAVVNAVTEDFKNYAEGLLALIDSQAVGNGN